MKLQLLFIFFVQCLFLWWWWWSECVVRIVAHFEHVFNGNGCRSPLAKKTHNASACKARRHHLPLGPHNGVGILHVSVYKVHYDLVEHAHRVAVGIRNLERAAEGPNVIVKCPRRVANLLFRCGRDGFESVLRRGGFLAGFSGGHFFFLLKNAPPPLFLEFWTSLFFERKRGSEL
jgi:hypothetical protein